MRHSIPNWIDALLTADGDETQRSGVKNFRVTKAAGFSSFFSSSFLHARIAKGSKGIPPRSTERCLLALRVDEL